MNEHEIYNRHQKELAERLEKRFSIIDKKLELIASHIGGIRVEIMDDESPGGWCQGEITLNQSEEWRKLSELS